MAHEKPRASSDDRRFGGLAKIAYSSIACSHSLARKFALRSYPNGVSNRAADYIPPGFFCLSVPTSFSNFSLPRHCPPSVPRRNVDKSTGTPRDSGFADLRRATSKWNKLLRGTTHAVVEARAGSDRFVTSPFSQSLPFPRHYARSSTERVRMKSLEEFSLIASRALVPSGAYIP